MSDSISEITSSENITLTNRWEINEIDLGFDRIFGLDVIDGKLYGVGSMFKDDTSLYFTFNVDIDGQYGINEVYSIENGESILGAGYNDAGEFLMLISGFSGGKSHMVLRLYDGSGIVWETPAELENNMFLLSSSGIYWNDGRWNILYNGYVHQFDSSGDLIRQDMINQSIVSGGYKARDGVHIFGIGWQMTVSSNGLSSDSKWDNLIISHSQDSFFGAKDYDYLRCGSDGLWGGSFSGNEEMLADWSNSDFAAKDVSVVYLSSKDEGYIYSVGSGKENVYTMKRTDDITYQSSQVIRVCYISFGNVDYMQTAAVEFNKLHPEIRVIPEIMNTADDYAVEVNKNLAAGTAADILMLPASFDVESYINKNVFADLYSVGSSPIKPDELLNCARSRYELDNRLYLLPSSFRIVTMSAEKSTVNKSDWTVEEFIRRYDAADEEGKHLIQEYSRSSVEDILDNYICEEFMDLESGNCNYESREFTDLIEWLKQLPENGSVNVYNEESFISGDIRMGIERITDISSYIASLNRWGEYSGELIGLPSVDGGKHYIDESWLFGINNASENQDYAADFLRYYLENQDLSISGYISPVKKVTERNVNSSIDCTYIYDPIRSTSWISTQNITEIGNDRSKIYISINRSLIENFISFLENIDKTETSPHQITDIVYEELEDYFYGKRTSSETANNIQNRVQLWINEHR